MWRSDPTAWSRRRSRRRPFRGLPLPPRDTTPINAADPALLEHKGELALPKIAEDGRMAWRVYARPFASRDDRPRIAVDRHGSGTQSGCHGGGHSRLPADVTLAFHPDAVGFEQVGGDGAPRGARGASLHSNGGGRFPVRRSGTKRSSDEPRRRGRTLARLERTLGRLTGFAGVISVMGSKFSPARGQPAAGAGNPEGTGRDVRGRGQRGAEPRAEDRHRDRTPQRRSWMWCSTTILPRRPSKGNWSDWRQRPASTRWRWGLRGPIRWWWAPFPNGPPR